MNKVSGKSYITKMVNILRTILFLAHLLYISCASATSIDYYKATLTHLFNQNVQGNDIDNKSVLEYELKRLLLHKFKFILQDLEKKIYEDNYLNDVEEVQY